jgi:hypothetical protein
VSVARPFAYAIAMARAGADRTRDAGRAAPAGRPGAPRAVLERLASHGLVVRRLTAPVRLDVEAYDVVGRETTQSPDVGDAPRTETVLAVRPRRTTVDLEPGDVLVPTAQPWANLAIYLLEPHSDDGFARWGFYDAFLATADLAAGVRFPVSRLLADPGPLPTTDLA